MFDYLHTSDQQFGFKRAHSTLMPVVFFTATIMYVCYLDASKAFDRVDYSVLFRKLINRGISGYIVGLRLLWNWYSCHQARVQWAHVLTNPFSICNGFRQGGILSLYLRCILMICQYGFNQYTLVVD